MSRMLRPAAVALATWSVVSSVGFPVSGQQLPPQQRRQRPMPQVPAQPQEALVETPVSPDLQRLLEAWEQSSKQIQKLQGKHKRMVQDLTWNVEKQSSGEFVYEAPDRGRIDIEPLKIGANAMSENKNPKTGKPFELKSDSAEQWICDGERIMQIDNAKKECTIVEIPEASRGQNIMDGPLPFLFGMPAEEAKQRYRITLKSETAGKQHDQYYLIVEPRMQHDAANWKQAHVFLDRAQLLPSAVKLIDPSGNLETVYQFMSVEKNKERTVLSWITGDPFKPSLRGLEVKIVKATNHLEEAGAPVGQNAGGPPAAKQPAAMPPAAGTAQISKGGKVPDVIGIRFDEAKTKLVQAGYEVKFAKGPVAPGQKFEGYIMQQSPPVSTESGSVVTLTFYDKIAAKNAAPPQK